MNILDEVTGGEWMASKQFGGIAPYTFRIHADGYIGECWSADSEVECKANARLMAASKEMCNLLENHPMQHKRLNDAEYFNKMADWCNSKNELLTKLNKQL